MELGSGIEINSQNTLPTVNSVNKSAIATTIRLESAAIANSKTFVAAAWSALACGGGTCSSSTVKCGVTTLLMLLPVNVYNELVG